MDRARPPSATPGTLIGGTYLVERVVGEGATGVVVEARHLALEKLVAIKLLRLELQSPEILARFEREARVVAELPPDHVAHVTDAGRTEAGEAFLVMERLVGHDLAAELRQRGRLPVEEAVDLVMQACAGVAAAHNAGLVHRDLKPANLFLAQRRDGSVAVKVLDFGLSKAKTRPGDRELTLTGSSFGTPQYMAPEQIRSVKHVDARCDQHALGMILFEMLAARPPYEAPSVTAITVAIATEPPPHVRELRAEVPEALDEALVRALAKNPEDRFADLFAFAEALAPFGGDGARKRLEKVGLALTASAPVRAERSSLAPAASVLARTSLGPSSRDPFSLFGEGSPARRWQKIAAAVGAVALLAGLGLWALLRPTPVRVAASGLAPALSAALEPASAAPPVVVAPAVASAPPASTEVVLDVEELPSVGGSAPSQPSPSRASSRAPKSRSGSPPSPPSTGARKPKSTREVFGGD